MNDKPTPLASKNHVDLESISHRHRHVENSGDPSLTAQRMGYLSHLDRGELLAEIERLTREQDDAELRFQNEVALTERLIREIDWSRKKIEELDRFNTGLATESERRRAALESAYSIWSHWQEEHTPCADRMADIINNALSGEPARIACPAESQFETGARHALAEEIVELRGALLMLYDKWENGAPCYEEPEEQRGYFGHAFNLTEQEENRVLALLPEGCPEPSEKASARPSEGPGSILGCACIMCEYHRSAEDIERKRRAEAGESPCGG